jgi:hypothetical protein
MSTFKIPLAGASLALFIAIGGAPASAASVGNEVWLGHSAQNAEFIDVQRRVHRHPGHRPGFRPHPGYRPRPGYRPGYRPGGWARPGHYWWRPGAAVAAGAALGFVGAATAAAWAGPAPAPGMCWYYTNSARTRGYWDYCP